DIMGCKVSNVELQPLKERFLSTERIFKMMKKVSVRWRDKLQFIAHDSLGNSMLLNSPKEKDEGAKPSDLLPMGLASCSGINVLRILRKEKQDLRKFEIQVFFKQALKPPWKFEKIHLKYLIGGRNIGEKFVRRAIELSQKKYCSVFATLKGNVKLESSYEIEEVA
ncbi:MAG: OsmC family protein, partial [Candidatus Methanofastidiosia archaeon]